MGQTASKYLMTLIHLQILDKIIMQSQKKHKKNPEKRSTDMESITEHIVNLTLEIALLNTEIDIKVNNLVKVHFTKLEELKQNKIKEE
jgi:hypothetical protein